MFAIIETRTLKTKPEDFEAELWKIAQNLEPLGFFKSTKAMHQRETQKLLEEFLEACLAGFPAFQKERKRIKSEKYTDKDLCSQVWDLQADLKTKSLEYYCSELLDLEVFRSFLRDLKEHVKSTRPLMGRLDFTLELTRKVEEL